MKNVVIFSGSAVKALKMKITQRLVALENTVKRKENSLRLPSISW